MTTKRVTFYADETSLAYLERTQQETGACVSEIIRRALRKLEGPAPIETRQLTIRSSHPVLVTPRPEAE